MGHASATKKTDRSTATSRELAGETFGTALLVTAIVGSGIMAERLSGGNMALALLAASLTQGTILVVLITVLLPVSGAHINPAVTLAFVLRREMPPLKGLCYAGVQIAGGIIGVVVAHAMFELAPVQLGTHSRAGPGQWLGEAVATFALLMTILACVRHRPEVLPFAVGAVITAGNWYTSSASFANPAVTLARTLTDTLTSIRPVDAVPFIAVEFAGAAAAVFFARWIFASGSAR